MCVTLTKVTGFAYCARDWHIFTCGDYIYQVILKFDKVSQNYSTNKNDKKQKTSVYNNDWSSCGSCAHHIAM